jgi:hypothetical protein
MPININPIIRGDRLIIANAEIKKPATDIVILWWGETWSHDIGACPSFFIAPNWVQRHAGRAGLFSGGKTGNLMA